MNCYTNEQISASLDFASAADAIRTAYQALRHGEAAVQPRNRLAVRDVKFSTMSAMLAHAGVAAVKLYTTLDGQFRFHVALVSLDDGALLALFEGDAITRIRTAATTLLAADRLARATSRSLGLFGSGVQAGAHAEALLQRFGLREVRIYSRDEAGAHDLARRLCARFDVAAFASEAAHAAGADIVVSATRASTPVLRGEWLRAGAFVASIGATRPDQREMDDASLEAASRIVVDWRAQTPLETGDLVLAPPELLKRVAPEDLGDVLGGENRRADDASDIVIYKAVGIALQDAAVAHLAYTRLTTGQ